MPSRREKIIGASASSTGTDAAAVKRDNNNATAAPTIIHDPNQIDLLELIDKKSNAKGSLWTLVLGFYAIVIAATAFTVGSVVFDEVADQNSAPVSFASDEQEFVAVIEDTDTNIVTVDIEDIDQALPTVKNNNGPKSIADIIAEVIPDDVGNSEVLKAEATTEPEVDVLSKTETPETNNDVEPELWRKNADYWTRDTELPKIAIVIDDMGIVKVASERLAKMQGPFTLAFLPYARGVPEQAKATSKAGHELIIHMPMEPKITSADPGDNALLTNLASEQFKERLEWNFARFDGYVGINNHMGSLLTEDAGAMVQVMTALKQKNLLFLDSLTSPNSVGASAAKAVGVPHLSRDIFLDNIRSPAAIIRQLRRTEAIAKKRGYAVAIGHPYKETLDVLERWKNSDEAKGFTLVTISQLVAEQNAKTIVDADFASPNTAASSE